MNALGLLTGLLDAGTFRSWDASPADPPHADATYADALAKARAATGIDGTPPAMTRCRAYDASTEQALDRPFGYLIALARSRRRC
jgi:hypothetical protein